MRGFKKASLKVTSLDPTALEGYLLARQNLKHSQTVNQITKGPGYFNLKYHCSKDLDEF